MGQQINFFLMWISLLEVKHILLIGQFVKQKISDNF